MDARIIQRCFTSFSLTSLPPGLGFVYDPDTALLPEGKTCVLGCIREVGKGGVVYIALGPCHFPTKRKPGR